MASSSGTTAAKSSDDSEPRYLRHEVHVVFSKVVEQLKKLTPIERNLVLSKICEMSNMEFRTLAEVEKDIFIPGKVKISKTE